MRGIFAQSEKRHKTIIFEMYKKNKGIHIPDEFLTADSLKDFIEGGLSIEETLTVLMSGDRTLQDILGFSMQMETNSLDLYIKMLREIKDKDAKEILHMLVGEEKTHLLRLGDLLNSKVEQKN